MRYELCTIWSTVYFHTHELPLSTHLKKRFDPRQFSRSYLVIIFRLCMGLSLPLARFKLYQNSSSSFLSLSYFLPSPLPPPCFQPMGLCFKWQFLPFVRSATLNINFLTEHTLRPNRRNKISAIYCATPSSLSWHRDPPLAPSSKQPTSNNT